MFTELKVGDHSYKLRLTTQGTVSLEKSLGYNPLQMFMGIDNDVLPKVGDMMVVLHQMMQPYNHGVTLSDVYDIFDEYLKEGHSIWDIVPVIVEAFQEAGFLPKEESGDEKN